MKICYDCMREIPDDAGTCPYCGYKNEDITGEVYYIKPGSILANRYKIGKVVGFGGFGIVYKAWDTNLNQMVAIKEYFPTMYISRVEDSNTVSVFDKKNIEPFEKGKNDFLLEARTLAKYNSHPNIVHVYDFFEENGTSYFVMEYLDGYTLGGYIKEAKRQGKVISVNSATNVTLGILNALKTAHANGIIHRDLKPSNIFILDDGTIKLYDFGAARLSDDAERTRTIIITPGYAPPEQYQVNSVQGAFTDIYAVGAIMYEMLTGIRPEESINRTVVDEVDAPSNHNSKIPEYLDAIIMRAMAVRPEIRFKNVQMMEEAIRHKISVRNDREEIKRRKRIRNLIISAISAVILLFGIYCGQRYYRSYMNAVLAETDVDIWIPTAGDGQDSGLEMYEAMLEEFMSTYPQVGVRISPIPYDGYEEKLADAIARGEGPDVYSSTGLELDGGIMADIRDIYDDLDMSSYYVLGQYEKNPDSAYKIPISIDIPVRYCNLLYENEEDSDDYEAFINDESNYLGYVTEYDTVQEDMAGRYIIDETKDDRKGRLYSTWSINCGCNADELAAGKRILYYFLSDIAQEIYTVEYSQGLPLNKEVWDIYMDVNSDFDFLTDIVDTYTYE